MSKRCCPLARFDRPGSFHYACNDPDKCMGCGQPKNSWVSGGFRCKCEQPKMPRDLMDKPGDDRPTPQVRYGN